jgi:hypothetical protein
LAGPQAAAPLGGSLALPLPHQGGGQQEAQFRSLDRERRVLFRQRLQQADNASIVPPLDRLLGGRQSRRELIFG